MPAFFYSHELAAVIDDFEQLYSHVMLSCSCAVTAETNETPKQFTSAAQKQFEHVTSMPFDCSPALNLLGLHPELINFAKAAMGVPAVRMYQCLAWAKFSGQANFEQPFHMDYVNHTLTVPGDCPAERTVNFSIYMSNITNEHGAIRYVRRPEGDEVCGIARPMLPAGAQQDALRKIELSGAGPVGSVFAYSTDVYHRGTNLTAEDGRRYTLFVGYKAAQNESISFTSWPTATASIGFVRGIAGTHKDLWLPIFEHAKPEQLECLNIPPPGNPFWTEAKLARAQCRWPTWNLEPWFRALPSEGPPER
jgi:hypothetical protein